MRKDEREALRMMFGGKCAYCGGELEKGWCADHVKAIHRNPYGGMDHPENDTKDNLFPACRVCNYGKNTMSVEAFRQQIGEQVKRARKESWNFRMAEKYDLIRVTDKPVVFWFERYGNEAT